MKPAAFLVLLAAVVSLAGCERVMRNMYDQPSLRPGDKSSLFADGPASRPPPPGTVPRAVGIEAAVSGGAVGEAQALAMDAANARQALPAVPGSEMLLRGQQRYTIYCLPCHGAVGDGDGMVVRRGFPAPPSYHQARLREAPDRHFYDVISQGYGVMYAYGDRIEVEDRWAIVAYVRALQTSRFVTLAELPPALRATVEAGLKSPVPDAAPPASGWRVSPGQETRP